MDTPTHYLDISEKALNAKEKYGLTDVQTLLYNHICRGDFKLRNDQGQKFYDKENEGFGWGGRRMWVKSQFNPLIKKRIVKFKELHDCNDKKYTSWYFYCPGFKLKDLIDAGCYSSVWKLAMLKHYFNLPDGFSKNEKYGDLEFISNRKGYSFKYKGEDNIYEWDHRGDGIKLETFGKPVFYDDFEDLIHDIWSFLAYDGYKQMTQIPNYSQKRQFSLQNR